MPAPPYRLPTLAAYHRFRGLPPPAHPLFSIIDLSQITHLQPQEPQSLVLDFYAIGFKKDFNARVRYGQQPFDFEWLSTARLRWPRRARRTNAPPVGTSKVKLCSPLP